MLANANTSMPSTCGRWRNGQPPRHISTLPVRDKNPCHLRRHLRPKGAIACTGTAAGKCFLDMLGVFAEFETNLRRERQLEGIAKAKAAGVYKGRPASIDAAQVRAMKAQGM
jgi:resolvase-like protein